MTLGKHMLFKALGNWLPDAPCLLTREKVYSRSDVDRLAADWADTFSQAGARAGRWIALRVAPTPEAIVDLLALWRCGAGVVLLDANHPPEWAQALTAIAGVSEILTAGHLPETVSWTDVAGMEDGPAVAVFTSGTESKPKAVVHTLDTLCVTARAGAGRLGIGDQSVLPMTLPLFHVSGLMTLMRAILAGAACRLPSPEEGWRDILRSGGYSHVSLVAAQLSQGMGDPDIKRALQQAKRLLLGGGPVSDTLLDQAWRDGIPVINSYGMTETAAMAAMTDPEVNPAGAYANPLYAGSFSVNGTGRILIRGPMLFAGWLESGKIRRLNLEPDGWYRTGDIGEMNDAGGIRVQGRADSVIISGGEKIHPEWLAAALMDLPGVFAACVAGVPDATYGEVPAAILAMREGEPLPEPETVKRHLQGRFPDWMRPHYVFAWPEEVCAPGPKPPIHRLKTWAMEYLARKEG